MKPSSEVGKIFTCLLGSFLGYVGIFLPGLSVKVGVWPYWTRWRPGFQRVLDGVASSAVGMVFASGWLLWKDIQDPNPIYITFVISTCVWVGILDCPPLIVVLVSTLTFFVAK